ncbi:MAG: hypothetical protein LBQ34_00320 [Alphaproteobacteria bacterium]|jgi:hypothetical protein|nr:hypothetical protein [Alphaproteobacteria bacterium]
MNIIASNLYKALIKAGVEENLAEKASLEVAESTRKVSDLEVQVKIMQVKLNVLITIVIAFFATFIGTILTKF